MVHLDNAVLPEWYTAASVSQNISQEVGFAYKWTTSLTSAINYHTSANKASFIALCVVSFLVRKCSKK